MANNGKRKTNNIKSNNIKNQKKNNVHNTTTNKHINKNNIIMKVLVAIGVVIFGFIIVYLGYHFFVEKSDILINVSTDKKMEYINIEGEEELIVTQKYVSDLSYSMRYDVNNFRVFKHKEQDIFKFLHDERVLVVVEKSTLPSSCIQTSLDTEYNNCNIKVDDYTEEYYLSTNERIYKITIKTPGTPEYVEGVGVRINFMLNNFEINDLK